MKHAIPFRDRIIPWYFVMFFAVVALVDGVMVTLAVRTHTGTVTDHPYEKGLAYNAVVEADAAQQKLGWHADIDYVKGELLFALYDRSSSAITPPSATARIRRPAQAGMDFEVALSNGRAPVSFPEKGLWEVRIFAVHDGKSFQQAKRLVIE